jgi:hypothetical protein
MRRIRKHPSNRILSVPSRRLIFATPKQELMRHMDIPLQVVPLSLVSILNLCAKNAQKHGGKKNRNHEHSTTSSPKSERV